MVLSKLRLGALPAVAALSVATAFAADHPIASRDYSPLHRDCPQAEVDSITGRVTFRLSVNGTNFIRIDPSAGSAELQTDDEISLNALHTARVDLSGRPSISLLSFTHIQDAVQGSIALATHEIRLRNDRTFSVSLRRTDSSQVPHELLIEFNDQRFDCQEVTFVPLRSTNAEIGALLVLPSQAIIRLAQDLRDARQAYLNTLATLGTAEQERNRLQGENTSLASTLAQRSTELAIEQERSRGLSANLADETSRADRTKLALDNLNAAHTKVKAERDTALKQRDLLKSLYETAVQSIFGDIRGAAQKVQAQPVLQRIKQLKTRLLAQTKAAQN